MANRTLIRMREMIRKRQYVLTLHAEEEMDNDDLTIFDVENVILTGELFQQQRDRKTSEKKYLVRGKTLRNRESAVVVSRFGFVERLVILTVYAE